jgi:hypothetical protein
MCLRRLDAMSSSRYQQPAETPPRTTSTHPSTYREPPMAVWRHPTGSHMGDRPPEKVEPALAGWSMAEIALALKCLGLTAMHCVQARHINMPTGRPSTSARQTPPPPSRATSRSDQKTILLA